MAREPHRFARNAFRHSQGKLGNLPENCAESVLAKKGNGRGVEHDVLHIGHPAENESGGTDCVWRTMRLHDLRRCPPPTAHDSGQAPRLNEKEACGTVRKPEHVDARPETVTPESSRQLRPHRLRVPAPE